MVTLITVLVSILVFVTRDKQDFEHIRNRRYWIEKAQSKKKYTLLFAGDSRVFRGISPDDFEKALKGYKGYNLGFSSNGYSIEYMDEIERRLDCSVSKPIVVLGITAYGFTEKGFRSDHFKAERMRPREDVIQYMYLTSVNEYFARVSPLTLIRRMFNKPKPKNFQITYHYNGWMESYWIQPDTMNAYPVYQTIFNGNICKRDYIEVLLDRVNKWTEEGILVFGFRPPATHYLLQLEEQMGEFDARGFESEFQNAGGIWLTFPANKYNTFDGCHLDNASARKLSYDMGEKIKEFLKH